MPQLNDSTGGFEAPSPAANGTGAERRRLRDWRQATGPKGEIAATGATDIRILLGGLAALAVVTGVVNTLDVLTMLHEEPQNGIAGPIVWEGTAGFTILVAAFIPWLLLKYAPLERPPLWRTILIYAAAAPLFSVVHVASFVTLRMIIYWAAGTRYDFGPVVQNFEYEASKDIFGYFGAIFAFWFARRLVNNRLPSTAAASMLDIRDGARLTRVRTDDVLAVTSAGNYVEFVLRDGRRPLMRKPLSAMENELRDKGFVRTHRSWLVNAMQVTGLKPEGSGDYAVEVGTLSVPLSRRFPEALAKLRAG